MNFKECVMECASAPGFVDGYDKLTGSNLSALSARSLIAQMIDSATGYEESEAEKFISFVYEFVWCRIEKAS